MISTIAPNFSRPNRSGFTLIELLTVMTIIAILAGLALSISGFVQNKAARARAENEIKAMESACESYKGDNGIYPRNADTDKLEPRVTFTVSSYANAAKYLYTALSGDQDLDGKPDTNIKSYMSFKPEMLSRPDTSSSPSTSNLVAYVADPFGNAYGYSTAIANSSDKLTSASYKTTPPTPPGYNATFDLWSTGGDKFGTSTDPTSKWITNW